MAIENHSELTQEGNYTDLPTYKVFVNDNAVREPDRASD